MSDFLDSIKVTDEDKKKFMSKVIFTMVNSARILSFDEFLEQSKEIKEKLNENEILATYSLAKEIKQTIVSSSDSNKKLFEYLQLHSFSINEDKLLKFISQAAHDIEITNQKTPNAKWSLQIGKILARLEGKNPYDEEVAKNTQASSQKETDNKIIDIKEYLEK